jgi:tRNA(Ile)-lysidine synthase
MSKTVLASVLVCAGGGSQTPRGERLMQLAARLAANEDFTATLSGVRVVAQGETVLIGREPGDLKRRPAPDVRLEARRPAVWDGRYELTASEPGWTVTSAAGRLSALGDADRAILRGVPAWARGGLPVLIRESGADPVLAWRRAEVRALAPRRLELALSASGSGETTQESHLFRPVHGETPPTDLFSRPDHEPARVSTRRRGTEDRNESA